jgi:NhaP-type Na+/H+ or K+/H+ antiporter
VLLEGESLLNDASGLTLFEVFLHLVSGGGGVPASSRGLTQPHP